MYDSISFSRKNFGWCDSYQAPNIIKNALKRVIKKLLSFTKAIEKRLEIKYKTQISADKN